MIRIQKLALIGLFGAALPVSVMGHGDVQPQAVDTAGLESVGKAWAEENPFRLKGGDQYKLAVKIGSSAYSQNCARCHGLQAISGGIAPDLRELTSDLDGDEWYLSRVRKGYSQNGAYKMPPFEGLMNQEAMWAIRSYIETRPKE